MTASNFPNVQQSDWSTPPSVPQHHQTNNRISQMITSSNKMWSTTADQNQVYSTPTQSSSSILPVLSGVLMGALAGGLILTVILPLWLTASVNKTTTSTVTAGSSTTTLLFIATASTTSLTTTTTASTTSATTTTTAPANITNTYSQSDPVNLVCPTWQKLSIVYSFYGVPSCADCTCGYCVCANMTVTPTIQTSCTGFASCSFNATDTFLGDPCYSYGKTFIVTYYCS